MKLTRVRSRLATLTALIAVPVASLAALPASPAHADEVVTISGEELHEALFVAGDMSRLNQNPREAVLERVLQAMYEIEPHMPVSEARAEIQRMRAEMKPPTAPASASRQTAQAGPGIAPTTIFRVDHYVEMLEKEAAQAAKTAKAKKAVRQVVKKSLVEQEDEKSLLAISPTQEIWSGLGDYGYFSGDKVVQDSFKQAAINDYYAQARDKEWAAAAGQSTDSTIEQRVNDPDLAGADGITDNIDGDTLRMSGQDALEEADKALNGADGLGLANAAALNTAQAMAEAEEDIAKATTPEQKQTAEEKREQIKKEWEGRINTTKEVVKTTESALKLSVWLIDKFDPEAAKQVETVGKVVVKTANQLIDIGTNVLNGVMNVVSGNWVAAAGNLIGGVMGVFGLFESESAAEPAPDPVLVALGDLSEQMDEFRQEMHERFDRIDQALNAGFTAMIDGLNQIVLALDDASTDVREIKENLAVMQTSLVRLEARLFTNFRAVEGRQVAQAINAAIGYHERTGQVMTLAEFENWANLFYTGSTTSAKDAVALAPVASNYDARTIAQQLDDNPLDMNIEFLNQYAVELRGARLANAGSLVNPRDWALSARALELLLLENPQYATGAWQQRLETVRSEGVKLRTALARIHAPDTSAGTGNALLNALLTRYDARWSALDDAVQAEMKTVTDGVPGQVDLWKGPRQSVPNPATITSTNSAAGAGTASEPCSSNQHLPLGPGLSYDSHVPPQVTVAVALKIGVVNMCVDASLEDEDVDIDLRIIGNPRNPSGTVHTKTQLAKPKAVLRWDYTHTAAPADSQWLSHGTKTWPQQEICSTTTTTDYNGSPTNPENWVVTETGNCDGVTAESVLATKWGSTGPSIDWRMADQDEVMRIHGMVDGWMRAKQDAVYTQVSGAFTRSGGSAVQSAADELYAAKRLIQSYLEAGLPADLLVDGALRGLISGEDELLNDRADLRGPWIEAKENGRTESTNPREALDSTATTRLETLRDLLGDHVRGTPDEPLPPVEFRADPLLQTTITRIELARFVLEEEAADCTVKPSDVAAAQAKLTQAKKQLTKASKKRATAKKQLIKHKSKLKKAKKSAKPAKVKKLKKKVKSGKKKLKAAKKKVKTAKKAVAGAKSALADVRNSCAE